MSRSETDRSDDRPRKPRAEAADPRGKAAALLQKALDPKTVGEVEQQLPELTEAEAAMFVELVERAMKKRRLLLLGYLGGLLVFLFSMGFALYTYGTREPGTFVGWVFLIPFAAIGGTLWLVGRLAKKM